MVFDWLEKLCDKVTPEIIVKATPTLAAVDGEKVLGTLSEKQKQLVGISWSLSEELGTLKQKVFDEKLSYTLTKNEFEKQKLAFGISQAREIRSLMHQKKIVDELVQADIVLSQIATLDDETVVNAKAFSINEKWQLVTTSGDVCPGCGRAQCKGHELLEVLGPLGFLVAMTSLLGDD